MTFFEKNPQRASQWSRRRRSGRSGPTSTCLLHTFEAPPGRSALAGATWLTQRTDYGSYHNLCDTSSERSGLQLAPWDSETWHAAGVNDWTVGISAMMYAHMWSQLTATQKRNLVHSMAFAAHQFSRHQVRNGRPAVRPRFLTRTQVNAGESGFAMHSTVDPASRTDAGANFPRKMFLDEFKRLEAGRPNPTQSTSKGESAVSVWNDRTPKDHVNDKPSTMGNRLSRVHQYSHEVRNRVKSTAWRTWLATGIWGQRQATVSDLTKRWSTIRKDGYRARTWQQYTYFQARAAREAVQEVRGELREVKAMIKALAKATDEGQGKILDAVESAEREAIKVNAAEVAKLLTISTKEDEEAGDD